MWVVSIFVAGTALGLGVLFWAWRSAWANDVGRVVPQPIAFSHKHHVQGVGLDCRFCHASAEVSATAGMPSTQVCMTCHSQLYSNSPALAELRRSWESQRPIPWVRVHKLPDYVYFDHSAHLSHGIGCTTCHGAVNEMPWIAKAEPLTMGWCINCHRAPGPYLRAPDELYSTSWEPERDPAKASLVSGRLEKFYGLGRKEITNCYTCHR
jgi:hypothetical protein